MDFIDEIRCTPKALIATFKTKVRTLSTSPLCGGVSDEIRSVFNYDGKEEAVRNAGLRGKNYEEHMRALAKELQLDPIHMELSKVIYSFQHLFPRLSGKSEDHMDDHRESGSL